MKDVPFLCRTLETCQLSDEYKLSFTTDFGCFPSFASMIASEKKYLRSKKATQPLLRLQYKARLH